MKLLKVDPLNPESEAVQAAADAILSGELVVFPTETVYGLAADALDPQAVQKVFLAKGRAETQSLPVQVASVDQLDMAAEGVPAAAKALADEFWPGPLTLVLKRRSAIPEEVSGGRDTVGIRIPDHPVALALLARVGRPIIATSANLTSDKPATTAGEAVAALGESVSIVLDAGPCPIGIASTVVDMTVNPPAVLRKGSISLAALREVLEEIDERA